VEALRGHIESVLDRRQLEMEGALQLAGVMCIGIGIVVECRANLERCN
jgi:hypothetical protein